MYNTQTRQKSPFADLWCQKALGDVDRAALSAVLADHRRDIPAAKMLRQETEAGRLIYVVLQGWIALTKALPEGQTQIIDFGLPGDFFDLSSADGETAVLGLETVTKAAVAVVPSSEWLALVQSWPSIATLCRQEAAATRSRIAERMLRLGRGSAEERLAYALLELGVRVGALRNGENGQFHVPITQQQLGDFMGLTSVHVCRTLRRMTRQNMMTATDHIDLHLLDIPALETLAGISAKMLEREIMPQL